MRERSRKRCRSPIHGTRWTVRTGGDDYFRGKGVYEKTFAKPELAEGQRLYVEFRGVNSSAEVKLNGKTVATHDGGYSTFRADLTDGLAEENVLTVIADNSKNDHVYPQRADLHSTAASTVMCI